MTTDYSNAAYPRTCEAFVKLGIDPKTVASSGISMTGYDVFVLLEDGAKKLVPGEWGAAKVRKEFPDSASANLVLEQFFAEKMARA